MSRRGERPIVPLPMAVLIVGSVAIAGHLLALAALVLGAPSGPWITPYGPSMALAPQFTQGPASAAVQYYLQPLKMTHTYHFASNRPAQTGVYLEFHLKDESGHVMKTMRFPDETANRWVLHRQGLLARALAEDLAIPPPTSEAIAAPGQHVRTVQIWEPAEGRTLQLRAVPEHLVPRDRPVFGPSPWSMLLARSYGRYLCRTQGAASVRLVRHTQEPVLPVVLFVNQPVMPGEFEPLAADFGELAP